MPDPYSQLLLGILSLICLFRGKLSDISPSFLINVAFANGWDAKWGYYHTVFLFCAYTLHWNGCLQGCFLRGMHHSQPLPPYITSTSMLLAKRPFHRSRERNVTASIILWSNKSGSFFQKIANLSSRVSEDRERITTSSYEFQWSIKCRVKILLLQ